MSESLHITTVCLQGCLIENNILLPTCIKICENLQVWMTRKAHILILQNIDANATSRTAGLRIHWNFTRVPVSIYDNKSLSYKAKVKYNNSISDGIEDLCIIVCFNTKTEHTPKQCCSLDIIEQK